MSGGVQESIPRVLAAMAALDDAVVTHKLLSDRLKAANDEAEHLDEQLRRVDPDNRDALLQAAQRFAVALSLAQRIAWREERARRDLTRAQTALDLVRRADHKAHLERLRIELTIDAASIWDTVGRFEQQLRERLEQHAALAQQLALASRATGAALKQLTAWAPALGTSGPALWRALADGVRPPEDATPYSPLDREPPDEIDLALRPAPRTQPPRAPEPVLPIEIPPALQAPFPPEAPQSTRIGRVLKTLARIVDSDAPPRRKPKTSTQR